MWILAVLAIAAFSSCNSGVNDQSSESSTDSSTDSQAQTELSSNRQAEIEQAMLEEEIRPPTNRQPVSIIAKWFPSNSKTTNSGIVAIRMEFAAGWHVYGELPADSMFRSTKINLNLPSSAKALGKWVRQESSISRDEEGLEYYSGDIVVQRNIEFQSGFDASEMTVSISYQACNDSICLPPRDVEIVVEKTN